MDYEKMIDNNSINKKQPFNKEMGSGYHRLFVDECIRCRTSCL
jgi:hypothetical protein